MPTINNLSTVTTVTSGDLVPIYSQSNGDARAASMSTILAYVESNFASPDFETVTAAPTSGFTETLDASTTGIWLILSPAGSLASGTIVLPDPTDCFDGQTIIVTSSKEITTLTVNGNGATVNGAPTTLGADGFFQLRFYALTSTWWCVAQSLGALNTFTNPVINGSLLSPDSETMLAFAQTGAGTAVNYITARYSIAGQPVSLEATGASANIEIRLVPKGSGGIRLEADSGGAILGGASVSVFATTGDVSITADAGDVVLAATAGVIDAQSRMEFATAPLFPVTTFGNLPGTPIQGMRAIITDSSSATFNATASGGGANIVPVFYNGTDWKVG